MLYTVDTIQLIDANTLIIRIYINKSPFFIGFLLFTFSDFECFEGVLKTTYTYDQNTRQAARVRETEIHWIRTKTP